MASRSRSGFEARGAGRPAGHPHRIWAKRGTRPRAPRDPRYPWAYIFGAVCPARGTAAGLVMPFADTPAMNAHLAEIARTVATDAHAVLVLDGAGWHGGHDLVVPENISLILLPPSAQMIYRARVLIGG